MTTRAEIQRNRAALRVEYQGLYTGVSAILFEEDPIKINFKTNTDEYEPEVDTILPRLKTCTSVSDVLDVVHEEFMRWFGSELVGPKKRYEQIATRIWTLKCQPYSL